MLKLRYRDGYNGQCWQTDRWLGGWTKGTREGNPFSESVRGWRRKKRGIGIKVRMMAERALFSVLHLIFHRLSLRHTLNPLLQHLTQSLLENNVLLCTVTAGSHSTTGWLIASLLMCDDAGVSGSGLWSLMVLVILTPWVPEWNYANVLRRLPLSFPGPGEISQVTMTEHSALYGRATARG